jgi:hypothetical protein
MRRCLYLLPTLLIVHAGTASGQSSSEHVPTIGLLGWVDCSDAPFERGLRDLGYKVGESIKIECRLAGGRYSGWPAAAQELVGLPVDIMVTGSQPSGRAAHVKYSSLNPGMGATIRRLADLAPRTMGLMHGPSFSGDGAAALAVLADDYDRRIRKVFEHNHVPNSAEAQAA